jgi:hypothetical protein
MARTLQNAQFCIQYLANGMRALVVEVNTGELVAFELGNADAAALSTLLSASHPGHETASTLG